MEACDFARQFVEDALAWVVLSAIELF